MADFLKEFEQWIKNLKSRKPEDLEIIIGETGEWLKHSYDKIEELQARNDNQAAEIVRLYPFAKENAKLTGENKRLIDDIFRQNDNCVKIRRKLEAEIEKLEEENRWIPVSEPPNNVLEVWVIGGELIQTGRYVGGKWLRIGYGGGMLTNITHWMPIILPNEALKDKQDG